MVRRPTDPLTSLDGVRLDAAMRQGTSGGRRGAVVLAHGLSVDLDEGGLFVRLADRLAGLDFDVLRFSFRGHGASGGSQRGMTVAGEILDLQAAVEYVEERHPGRLSIVAASFGAVSATLCLPWLADRLDRLALWYPVLDPYRTFVEPELPGAERFDAACEVGWVLFEELRHWRPLDRLLDSAVPTLIVHGDRDTAVSYEVAETTADARAGTVLHTVRGSDHGFGSREHAEEAIRVTVEWLAADN